MRYAYLYIRNSMIKVKEISSTTAKAHVGDIQIEKDYVISWLLYGIANNPFLKEHLLFKGGAVLKKAYFPAYRYSDDLEFTFQGDFTVDAIKFAFSETIKVSPTFIFFDAKT